MRRFLISRRQLLFGSGAAVSLGVLTAFCEPKWLHITGHDVPVRRLPRLLDGYRIAHITDAHLKHIGIVEQAILREIESRNVNMVALTGDIIDDPLKMDVLEEFCRHPAKLCGSSCCPSLGACPILLLQAHPPLLPCQNGQFAETILFSAQPGLFCLPQFLAQFHIVQETLLRQLSL